MNCEQVRQRIPDYVHGDTSPADRHALSSHLDTCYLCREEHEQALALHRLCQTVLSHPAPVNRFEQLELEMNLGHPRHLPGRTDWQAWAGRAVLAACLLLIAHVCQPIIEGNTGLMELARRQMASPGTLDRKALSHIKVPAFSRDIVAGTARIQLALEETLLDTPRPHVE
jgi:predicted anti-sigma-YlaC factor YlaD